MKKVGRQLTRLRDWDDTITDWTNKVPEFTIRRRASVRRLVLLPGSRRVLSLARVGTTVLGFCLIMPLWPLGFLDPFVTVYFGVWASLIGSGLGGVFFPVGSNTPFGPIAEIKQMSGPQLQERYDQIRAERPREVRRYMAFLKHPYAARPPYWVSFLIAADRGEFARPGHTAPPALVTAVSVNSVRDRHDAVLARWAKYELDVGALIDYPSMSDVRVPKTAAMVRAMRAAADAREGDDSAQYRRAVTVFEIAFDAAEQEARERAASSLSEGERARLGEARRLLALAEDNGATEPERQLAFRRLRRVLDGLIVVPPAAVAALERRVMLQLSSGAGPAVSPQPWC